jgi:membrane associated rhomboid family serine protease
MPLKKSFTVALMIVASLWAVFILNQLIPIDLNHYGIIPRTKSGIKGILFAPFLHLNLMHIMSNTIPLFILTTVLFWMYEKVAVRVLVLSALMGGLLVWIFARPSVHIGASGVIFSLVGFIIASGIFRKKIKPLLIGIVIFFLYGGIIWGILPNQPGVSWEGHLFGLISGIALAYIFKDTKETG